MAIIDGTDSGEGLADTATNDFIDAMGGDDIVTITSGIDNADGGGGDDVIRILWGDTTFNVFIDNNRALPGTRAYVDTDGSWADSKRKVQHNGFEHYDVISGSGDDDFRGFGNSWDKFDGGAGDDHWFDSLSNIATNLVVDMAELSTRAGKVFVDGTTIIDVESVTLTLGTGDDTFRDNGVYDDYVDGFEGNDTIRFSYGIDGADGGAGDDVLILDYADATDSVFTSNSRALPGTRAYVDTDGSWADSTRKVLHNGFEHYDVRSGAGDDDFSGWFNSWDKFDGGAGVDHWRDSFSTLGQAISVDMMQVMTDIGQTYSDGTAVKNIERATLTLTEFDDTFRDAGEDYVDSVSGGGGNDDIGFTGGRNSASGGEGDDVLTLDWSDATFTVFTSNSRALPGTRTYEDTDGSWIDAKRAVLHNSFEHYDVKSGSADDSFTGWTNAWDKFDGGDGVDNWRDNFSGVQDRMVVTMAALQADTGQSFLDGSFGANIESVYFTLTELNDVFRDNGAYDDVIYGVGGDDKFYHSDGTDFFSGGEGKDKLFVNWSDTDLDSYFTNTFQSRGYVDTSVGFFDATRSMDIDNTIEVFKLRFGAGDDQVFMGSTKETVTLGEGDDWARLGSGNDKAKGGAGDDTLEGGDDKDVLIGGSGVDDISGDGGADRLVGGGGGDTIDGGDGSDVILGGGGGDVMTGGTRDDRMNGGRGNDEITGGDGADLLTGGRGADRFIYRDLNEGRDTITDFNPLVDVIDVSGLRLGAEDISLKLLNNGNVRVKFGETVITVDAREPGLSIDDFVLI